MHEIDFLVISQSTDLVEAHAGAIEVVRTLKELSPDGRVGYAAGIVASDGPEHIERNVLLLAEYANRLRKAHPFPIFSAVDVFGVTGLWDRFVPMFVRGEITDDDFKKFWRGILGSGYVTDVFMTPRWEFSNGARDEHETATACGIRIHYL